MSRPLLIALCVVTAGCATTGYRNGNFQVDPAYQTALAEPAPIVDADGGIRVTSNSLYSGRRAIDIGDLVTITIAHNTAADSSANTDLGRESDAELGISALAGLETQLAEIGLTPSLLVKANTRNNFKGSGGTTRTGALTATLTARVVDVESNGILVIGGRQAMKINNEIQILTLRGRVDPRSIGPDNTVSSAQIADARIEYSGMGVVASKQRPGWLSRILDLITPF